MMNGLRWLKMAAALAFCSLVLAETPLSDDDPAPVAGEGRLAPANERGQYRYLIEFAEPGLVHAVRSAHGRRFDPHAFEAVAERARLRQQHTVYRLTIAAALDRGPRISHYYLATHSGMAMWLSPAEADIVRALPGVVSVERERLYELATYRGPSFIGADSHWDGSAVPDGMENRGEGIVIGVLDTGVDPDHPSFANAVACGHGENGAPDKLISFLDCAGTDGSGLCNGMDPGDNNGHGSHTSSTAGGNTLGNSASPSPNPPPPFTEISGVAPCAHIRSYKVCPTTSCPGADIQAGMNSVLLHGDVEVMNFSISGGTSPWTDNDRRKLDLVGAGVLVASSAGNTSQTTPQPVAAVNHRGPWVLTVAASSRDGEVSGLLSVTGPGDPPPGLEDIPMNKGSDSPPGEPLTDHPIRHFTEQPIDFEGCTPGEGDAPPGMEPFPPDFFIGAVALIHRGGCTFTEKITNAFNAGADMVVIRNNQPTALSMATPGQPDIPAYSMDQVPGAELVTWVDANPDSATVDFETVPIGGDTLAEFSLRGPTPPPLQDLTKPDITAPGVFILAAFPDGYARLSGTSMSSPHVAGAAALVRAVRPDWTVSEVKSALMMTAFKDGTKEDQSTAWDADDVGSGRADLTKAALAGLVMDETFDNYLAADPMAGGDVKTLNIPAARNLDCAPSCTWTRTVRNTLDVPTNWSASGQAITPGFAITVEPPTFSFTGDTGETQVLTITATPIAPAPGAVAFGEVVLSESTATSPDLHITVAIQGGGVPGPVADVSPAGFEFELQQGEAGSDVLHIGNQGNLDLEWSIDEAVTDAQRQATASEELSEGFDDITTLPGDGWALINNSQPPGTTDWFQGTPVPFPAHEGFVDSYIAANFNNTAGDSGTISNWLLTPEVTLVNGTELRFWTRVPLASGFPDRLEVRLSTAGDSTDVGGTATSVGVFTELLLSINENLEVGGYPEEWTEFVLTVAGLDTPASGRFGLRYFVTNAGPDGDNSNYIGIDTLSISQPEGGGGDGCTSPVDVPWLAVSPDSGTTPPDDSVPVDVDVDTADLEAGDYQALLCINTNDPNAPRIELPVLLTVTDPEPPKDTVFEDRFELE